MEIYLDSLLYSLQFCTYCYGLYPALLVKLFNFGFDDDSS